MSKPKIISLSNSEGISATLATATALEPLTYGPFNQAGIGGKPLDQVSKLATIDKALRGYLISNNRVLLAYGYTELGMFQTVVSLPVDDAFKGGLIVKTDELDEGDIKQLYRYFEDNDLPRVKQAAKWCRLYGGAGLLAVTNQDPLKPLNIKSIKEPSELGFAAADMWELFDYATPLNAGQEIVTDDDGEELPFLRELENKNPYFSYYGNRVHRSRVLKMVGLEAPSFVRPRLRGWGLSCMEPIIRSINQYLKATNLSFEVLDEFKIDIFKLYGLNNALMDNQCGLDRVRAKVAHANMHKSYNNALVLDKEDDYENKQLSFTGIAEAMAGIRMQYAADVRMPQAKIFGTGSSGFSSGDDDIDNYNGMVESEVRTTFKPIVRAALKLRCQSMFGFVPEDLDIEFKPLRTVSGVDEENIKTQKATRLQGLFMQGVISVEEYRDAINKSNLLDIQLEDSFTSAKPNDFNDGSEERKDDE